MKIKHFFYYQSLFLLLACSQIIKVSEPQKNNVFALEDKQRTCSEDIILVSESSWVIEQYKKLTSTSSSPFRSFEQKIILWSLLQQFVRPDLASATSQFHFIVGTPKGSEYFKSSSSLEKKRDIKKSDHYPFYDSLNTFSLQFTKRPLSLYLKWLSHNLSSSIPISQPFSDYLFNNRKVIKESKSSQQMYIKAGQILQRGESLSLRGLKKFYSNYKSPKIQNTLSARLLEYKFPGYSAGPLATHCNIDLKLYEHDIYLISKQQNNNYYSYALREKNKFFVGVLSQNPDPHNTLKLTPMFKASSYPPPPVFCTISHKKTHSQLILSSINDRDPGQHLFHLFNHGVFNAKDLKELNQYIQFPRHLFLMFPERLLFESHKASNEHLNSLISSDIPVYHVDNLGEIMAYAQFQSTGGSGITLDHRRDKEMTCQSKP